MSSLDGKTSVAAARKEALEKARSPREIRGEKKEEGDENSRQKQKKTSHPRASGAETKPGGRRRPSPAKNPA